MNSLMGWSASIRAALPGRWWPPTGAALLLCFLASGASAQTVSPDSLAAETVPPQEKAQFSGVWVLDEKASDDLGPALQRVAEAIWQNRQEGTGRGPSGGRGQRPGMGRGGGARPGGPDPGNGGMGSRDVSRGGRDDGGVGVDFGGEERPKGPPPNLAERLREGWSRLMIVHDGDAFEVVDASDRTRDFILDAQPHKRTTRQGDDVGGRAYWDGDIVVVESELADGTRFVYRYARAADGVRLIVTVHVSAPARTDEVSVRLVYNPA